MIKDKFGGLKKFFETQPDLFFVGLDHPFNPRVCLRRHLQFYPQLTVAAEKGAHEPLSCLGCPLCTRCEPLVWWLFHAQQTQRP